MAGTSLYFCFSLIAVLGLGLQIINLILIRRKGRTTFGITFKKGTPERKRATAYASNTNIGVTAVLLLVLTIHLIFVVHKLAVPEGRYSYDGLLFLAVLVVLMFIVMVPITRQQAKSMSDSSKDRRKYE
ncbi:MAG TPA: hypothetical protein VF809_00595 [Candidatus Saccharimonadales bacterium]